MSATSLSVAQSATVDGGLTSVMSASVVNPTNPALNAQWTASAFAAWPSAAVVRIRSDIPLDQALVSSYSLLRIQAKTIAAGAGYTDVLTVNGAGLLSATHSRLNIDSSSAGTASAGVATLTGDGIAKTVVTSAVTANSIIMLTYQSTVSPGILSVGIKTVGVGFQIVSSSGADASAVGWLVVN